MSVVKQIRDEVTELKLKSHLDETHVDATYIRIIDLLERQAAIIEILGEIDPQYLRRLQIESYNPLKGV